MQYLITYSYVHRWSGELRYASYVSAPGVSASEAIAMKFSDQYKAEFGETPTNSRTHLNVINVVELQPSNVDSVARYVLSC